MRSIPLDSQVNYVDGQGHTKKAKVIESLSPGAVRLELGENSYALAEYSAEGAPGTFHFCDEAKAVKAAAAEPEKKAPAPAAASNSTK